MSLEKVKSDSCGSRVMGCGSKAEENVFKMFFSLSLSGPKEG